MRPLAEMMGRELYWTRRSVFSRSYTLAAGDEVLVTLEMHGFTRSASTVTAAEGRWSVRRAHLLSRRLIVTASDGSRVAEFIPRFRSGDLRFETGEYYPIESGILPRSIRVSNSAGSPLVSQTWAWPSFRRVARVEIEPAGTAERRLSLVTAVAMIYLYYRRRAARSSG